MNDIICYVCETEVDACCNVCVPCYDKLQAELDKAIGKLTKEMLDHTGTKLALAKYRWIPVGDLKLIDKPDWRLFVNMKHKVPTPDMRYVGKVNVMSIIKANNFTHWMMPVALPESEGENE